MRWRRRRQKNSDVPPAPTTVKLKDEGAEYLPNAPRKFVRAFPFVWIIRRGKPPLRTDNLLIGCVSEYTLFNVNKTFIVDSLVVGATAVHCLYIYTL